MRISGTSAGKKVQKQEKKTLKRKKSKIGAKRVSAKAIGSDKTPDLKSPTTNISIKAELLAKNIGDGQIQVQESIPTIEKQQAPKEAKKTKRKKKIKKKAPASTENGKPLALMELYNTKKKSLKKLPKAPA